ncbi:hypothetical protein E2P81_ATG10507 [Venturia nashicola]|nr:hypothetical protein E2P81_ATG10507 [Venturia nashicola]
MYAQNATNYPTYGTYGPYPTQPWVAVPGVPATLLPDGFNGGVDYARTILDNVTAITFPHTDLVIQQPTPYDEWANLAIYTANPSVTGDVPPSMTAWPAESCGTYRDDVLHPSGKDESFLYTAANRALQDGMARLDATYILPKTTQVDVKRALVDLPSGLKDWLGTQENVIVEYPYITNCWTWNGEGQPTVHVPVNALTVTSSHIIDVQASSTVITHPFPHTENTKTSLDVPGQPHTEITRPTFDVTIPVTAHTEITQQTLDFPGNVQTESAHTEVSRTSLVVPPKVAHTESTARTLSIPRTAQTQTTLEEPMRTITTTAAKAVTAIKDSTLDVPEAEPTNSGQPGTAEKAQTADISDARPTSGGNSGRPNENNQQPPSNGGQNNGGNDRPEGHNDEPQTLGGVGGLISAIQSIASQQGGASQRPPNEQQNSPNRPIAIITTGSPNQRPASSVTGFVIGSQTASPGGAAVTRGGSTFSALPSGSGLQVVANGKTNIVPSATSAGSSPVQLVKSDGEYVFGDSTLTAGGQALTRDGTTFSALPSGGGVVAVFNGYTRTMSAAGSMITSNVQSGPSDAQYIVDGKTLTAGGTALTIAGTTYSALPSGSGIAVFIDGKTSTASVGETLGVKTAGSDSDLPTPVLLPADKEQLVTLGGKTYTAQATSGSLLILGTHTIRPGATTVIDGETLVLSGTNLVRATGTSTSNTGLGDAIMSGIGRTTSAGGESSATSTSLDAESTSDAGQRSRSYMRVLISALALFVFAAIF